MKIVERVSCARCCCSGSELRLSRGVWVALHVLIDDAGGASARCLGQIVEHHNTASCLVDSDHRGWASHAHHCGGGGHTGSQLCINGMRIDHCNGRNRVAA